MFFKNCIIAIPSKGRYNYINDYVLKFIFNSIAKYNLQCDKNSIKIFVEGTEYNKYCDVIHNNKVEIVKHYKNNLADCRDYIRQNYPDKYILYLDDDLTGIIKNGENDICNIAVFIEESIKYMEQHNLLLLSVNPTNNKYFCSNNLKHGLYLAVGCCYIEKNRNDRILYLENYGLDEKEDYYRTLQTYKYFSDIGRNDKYYIRHKYKVLEGGMNSDDRTANNKIAIGKLQYLFNEFFTIKTRKDGLEELVLSRKKCYNRTTNYIIYGEKRNIEEGIYLNDTMYFNDMTYRNIIRDENNNPIAIVIKGIFKGYYEKYNLPEFFNSIKNIKSRNRGAMAGKIKPELLSPSVKEYYDNGLLRYNHNQTQTRGIGFDVSNPVKSINLGYCRKNLTGNIYLPKLSAKVERESDRLNTLISCISDIYRYYIDTSIIPNIETLDYKYKPNSAFSSFTINNSCRCATHRDKNQLGWSAITYFKQNPEYTGTNLQFPEYDISVKIDDGDLIFFDSVNTMHSNSPIYYKGEKFETDNLIDIDRYSIICYNKF
jgi:hypothetical protein